MFGENMREETLRKIEERKRRFAEKRKEKQREKDQKRADEGLQQMFGEKDNSTSVSDIVYLLIPIGIVVFMVLFGVNMLSSINTQSDSFDFSPANHTVHTVEIHNDYINVTETVVSMVLLITPFIVVMSVVSMMFSRSDY